MRKFLPIFLLASAAGVPAAAAAAAGDREQILAEREEARTEREQAREERASRAEAARSERAERPERAAPVEVQADRRSPRDVQALRESRRAATDPRGMTAPSSERQRATIFRDRAEQRRAEAQERLAVARRVREPRVSRTPAPGTQPPPPTVQRSTPAIQWSSNWRNDSRYDWYNYRRRHHWLFHLGFYLDPFGWGYSPFMTGWRMWPSYYQSQYWLNDPWRYRLPYAPPGYRWVRYWDDAILVDTWSGEVVDVIYNFFW